MPTTLGGLSHALLRGIGLDVKDGATIPHLLFFAYQGTFDHHRRGRRRRQVPSFGSRRSA